MKRISTATLLAAAAAALVAAGPSAAQGMRDGGMHEAHARMTDHHRGGDGMHGGRGGDRMGGFAMLLETYDSDGDGAVSQEEIDAARQARLSEFDANGDGSLDITEYEALWLDAMRERMVDRFQAHDDDGDGAVTAEEFGEDYARIVARRDRNGDGVLDAGDSRRPMNAPEAPEDDTSQ